MAAAIRFTKPEREIVRDRVFAVASQSEGKRGILAICQSIIAKLDESERPRPPASARGTSISEAMAAFREVLGGRLVPPPDGASGMWAQMAKRVGALGITRLDCLSIAKTAGSQWRGQIKALSLVNQAETLLQASQLISVDDEPLGHAAGSVDMDEL